MRRMLSMFVLALAAAFSLPAAADPLDGVIVLHKDDITAVAQIKSMPERHVLLYFGDNLN